MRFLGLFLAVLLGSAGLIPCRAGLLECVPNSSLTLPFGHPTTKTRGTLTFTNAVCLTSPAGDTDRLCILEQHGRMIGA